MYSSIFFLNLVKIKKIFKNGNLSLARAIRRNVIKTISNSVDGNRTVLFI